MTEHGGAGSRWGHDRIAAAPGDLFLEKADRTSAYRNGFLMESGVECRLAAAGLAGVKDHLASAVLEHRYRGLRRIGAKLIHQAGYEECDPHEWEDTPSIPSASEPILQNLERRQVRWCFRCVRHDRQPLSSSPPLSRFAKKSKGKIRFSVFQKFVLYLSRRFTPERALHDI